MLAGEVFEKELLPMCLQVAKNRQIELANAKLGKIIADAQASAAEASAAEA